MKHKQILMTVLALTLSATRITSYNVCYTKLLRVMGRTTFFVLKSAQHRITSYNVCYTKLLRVSLH